MVVCFGLIPMAQAVGPDTEGNIAGANNGEGIGVLVSRTSGVWNTGTGYQALNHLTSGNQNTATGFRALFSDTDGGFNTAMGVYSLLSDSSGSFNTATGAYSLRNNTTGNANTAIGDGALDSSTGSGNTALGFEAGVSVTTANNVICIGSHGANLSNSCFIGNIFGKTSPGGIAVFVNTDGRLGTTTSSRRFKEEIKPMEQASEAVFALKPVTFRYKKGIDPQGIPQFGLVAEDVEEINPDLVVRDKNGDLVSVRYEAVNAMLLNEFLKEHCKVEELEAAFAQQRKDFQSATAQQRKDLQATVAQQQKEIQSLATQLEEQAARIQKVSAQLATASTFFGGPEVSRSAPQTIANTQ
jgi:hypothetical protein